MLKYGVSLTEEQNLIYETAKQFGQDRLKPNAEKWDVEKTFPEEVLAQLGELGLMGICVPMDHGGAEADTLSYVLALQALAESCASTSVTVAVCNLAANVLNQFGNASQKERWLDPLVQGRLGAGSFCLSEPHCGSDAAALKTTATEDGDYFVLNGSKQWITNGTYAGIHLVFAVTDPDKGSRGISCFGVEKDTPGLIIGPEERKMGLRASNTVPLIFENCRVHRDQLIGERGGGYGIALANLDGGRIGIAAQCLGIAEAAMKEGVQYAIDRQVFKKRVADFQASQIAIADSRAELDQAWMLTLKAAILRDSTGRSAQASSMAKLFASESCNRIVDRMLQLHGGYGFVEDFPIERYYRDARVTRIYEGTSEVQRIVIAREVIRAFEID